MDNKDKYINSLLLSLFLMQGEIDRLNQTLDLARKGELVYINNPEIAELKAELQNFKDMAIKGLDEFKDVGGCWGCGLQLQLNQDMEDIKQLKAENEKLKEATDGLLNIQYTLADSCKKYSETLQEIKELAEVGQDKYHNGLILAKPILDLITKAEE